MVPNKFKILFVIQWLLIISLTIATIVVVLPKNYSSEGNSSAQEADNHIADEGNKPSVNETKSEIFPNSNQQELPTEGAESLHIQVQPNKYAFDLLEEQLKLHRKTSEQKEFVKILAEIGKLLSNLPEFQKRPDGNMISKEQELDDTESSSILNDLAVMPFVKSVCSTGFQSALWKRSLGNNPHKEIHIFAKEYDTGYIKDVRKKVIVHRGPTIEESILRYSALNPRATCELIALRSPSHTGGIEILFNSFRDIANIKGHIMCLQYSHGLRKMQRNGAEKFWEKVKAKGKMYEFFRIKTTIPNTFLTCGMCVP